MFPGYGLPFAAWVMLAVLALLLKGQAQVVAVGVVVVATIGFVVYICWFAPI